MSWQFTKRSDGKISVTLDSNVWNFLFDRNIDLVTELPSDRFSLGITREVQIETQAIPDVQDKRPLKDYIARAIEANGIRTAFIFGFARGTPGPERYGGFGVGVWQSKVQREYRAAIQEQFLTGRPMRNSELYDNEGDAAVGALSFTSIVLTCENAKKSGPLRYAKENGGAVLYLRDFDQSGLTLRGFVEGFYLTL